MVVVVDALAVAATSPTPLVPHRADDPLALTWPVIPVGAVLCLNVSIDVGDDAAWQFGLRYASPSEQAQGARFLRREDAARHVMGRAALRLLLGRQLGSAAVKEEFVPNAWGKPELPGSDLHFSISHSGSEIWIAVTRAGPVGIDVERRAADLDCSELARVFHPEEAAAIRDSSAGEVGAAFLRCWTRKESVIKALGRGLSSPLDSFRVDTGPASADWLRRSPPEHPRSDWTTTDLPGRPNYHGAIAVMTARARFSLWCHRLGYP